MLTLIRYVPKAELRALRLQKGEKLACFFDCEDHVPVVALYREEAIIPVREAVPEGIAGVRPAVDASRFYIN